MRTTTKVLGFIFTAMLAFNPALAAADSTDISAPGYVSCTIEGENFKIVWTEPGHMTPIVKYSIDVEAYYDTVAEAEGDPVVFEVEKEFPVDTVPASQLAAYLPLSAIEAHEGFAASYLEAKVKGLHHGNANRQNHGRAVAPCPLPPTE